MFASLAALFLLGPAVTISPAPDGDALIAEYALDDETTAFAFAPNDTPQRADAWTPVGEGWSFDGRTLSREDGAAFDGFSMRLAPDPGFHDRRYVATSRVGDGWALYLAALGGTGAPMKVRFGGFGEAAVLRLPRHEGGLDAAVTTDGNDRRVAYVGPARHVAPGPVTLIAGPEVPGWIGSALTEDAGRVASVLEDRLGAPALSPPTIILSYDATREGYSFKGGALDGATMRLVIASDLEARDEERARALAGFAAHETVHVWLNEVWDTAENGAQPWLHEGAAEYLADRLSLDGEAFRAEAEAHLSGCLSALGERPLGGGAGPIYGQVPYDCGFAVQLAAELASTARGEGDVLDLWAEVTESAPDGVYDSALFLTVASRRGGAPFERFAEAMLTMRGALKPAATGEALGALGVRAEVGEPGARDGMALMREAMAALQQSACDGQMSFYSEPEGFRLALGGVCDAPFPADAFVTGVMGHALPGEALAAHGAMRAACAEGAEITLTVREGDGTDETAPFACDARIASPEGFAVLAPLPDLPPLRR